MGVISSFQSADKAALVHIAWSIIETALYSGTTDEKLQSSAQRSEEDLRLCEVLATLRVLLLVLVTEEDGDAKSFLLHSILAAAQWPVQQGVAGAGVHASTLTPAVREQLLTMLPLAHLAGHDCSGGGSSDDGRDGNTSGDVVRDIITLSIRTVEQYAGSATSSSSAADNVGINIGAAIAVLVAAGGCADSVRIGINNSNNSGGSEEDQIDDARTTLNPHRVERVLVLAAALNRMLKCLWSHAVPRGVQQVLARAALSCVQSAHTIVVHSYTANTVISNHAVQSLLEVVANALKIVNGPSFSEKSMEVRDVQTLPID